MVVSSWLRHSTQLLEDAGIGTARLDALVLLEDVTGIDRARLLAEPNLKISLQQHEKLKNLLNQRAKHIPLAYVRGKTEFYGRTFVITPSVLEPRPESEIMIEELKILPKLGTRPKIADIGTGSGALGITAHLELKNSIVTLLDIDPNALKVAKSNVDLFTLYITCIESDLLANCPSDYDVLLCNLPYVPDSYVINTAASHEPKLAIFGGKDGLDLYRKLYEQITNLQKRPLYILCEALPPQHYDLEAIAADNGYKLYRKNDFILIFSRIQ